MQLIHAYNPTAACFAQLQIQNLYNFLSVYMSILVFKLSANSYIYFCIDPAITQ